MMEDSSSEPSDVDAIGGNRLARAPAASSAVIVLSGCRTFRRIRNTRRLLYRLAPGGAGFADDVSRDRNVVMRPDLVGGLPLLMLSVSGSKSRCISSAGAMVVCVIV